jgi:putative membrane protein
MRRETVPVSSKGAEVSYMKLRLLRRRRPNTWKGIAAGMAGGLVASWTMNQFQALLSKASEKFSCNGSGDSGQEKNPSEAESEDATMKTADKLAADLLGKKLTKEQKKKLGPAVHYIFGAATGALYGALAEHVPEVTAAEGVPFGTAVFVGADEIAVPAFGLSKAPTEYPLSTHASALAAHIVYGITTEVVRKYVRRGLQAV